MFELDQQTKPLIEINKLNVKFKINSNKTLHAVNNVDLKISKGETLGLVGESGCGKTTLGRALKLIYPANSGDILFKQQSIKKFTAKQKKQYTKHVQMIFQDPYSSLDPRMTIREIIKEGMRAHSLYSEIVMDEKVYELLKLVGLSNEHANRFPHEFSGGQRQRIGIARALAVEPELIICDEPTSALDVSIQAQIVMLLKELQDRLGLTYLFISHDLAMVKYISDRVAVMYLGEIVEIAPTELLFQNPQHPYTKSLISAIQIPDPKIERSRSKIKLSGDITSPINISNVGCKFASRCPCVEENCHSLTTNLEEVSAGHFTRCSLGTTL